MGVPCQGRGGHRPRARRSPPRTVDRPSSIPPLPPRGKNSWKLRGAARHTPAPPPARADSRGWDPCPSHSWVIWGEGTPVVVVWGPTINPPPPQTTRIMPVWGTGSDSNHRDGGRDESDLVHESYRLGVASPLMWGGFRGADGVDFEGRWSGARNRRRAPEGKRRPEENSQKKGEKGVGDSLRNPGAVCPAPPLIDFPKAHCRP